MIDLGFLLRSSLVLNRSLLYECTPTTSVTKPETLSLLISRLLLLLPYNVAAGTRCTSRDQASHKFYITEGAPTAPSSHFPIAVCKPEATLTVSASPKVVPSLVLGSKRTTVAQLGLDISTASQQTHLDITKTDKFIDTSVSRKSHSTRRLHHHGISHYPRCSQHACTLPINARHIQLYRR